MTHALIELALETLPFLLLAAILSATGGVSVNGRWLVVSVLLILVHEALVTRFFWQLPWLASEGEWNWLGKGLGLAGMLAIAALPWFGRRRSGITLRQAPGSWPAWLVAGGLCLVAICEALLWDARADANSILFMFTLPGPQEELFYRGVLLLALNEAFTGRRRILDAELGWAALLTSVQFGAVHAISFDRSGGAFNVAYFLDTFLLGLAWAWIRERTGSLLAPALSHNFGNGVARLI